MKTFESYKKGINLGGWLSQCGDKYHDTHYSSFITEKDIETIASWGVDHVRLPIDYNVIQREDGSFIKERFHYIDDCIAWCRKNRLKLVLDIHKACGYVFDDASYCSFFTDEALQDIFVSLWEELATRYGNQDDIAFELLNEITSAEFAEPWNAIAKRTILAIRKIAPTTNIVLGGIFNSSIYGLTLLEAPVDDHIVFTFHCYNPLVYTHQGAYWVDRIPSDFRTGYPQKISVLAELSHKYFGNDFDAEFVGLGDGMINASFFDKLFAPAIEVAKKYDIALYCGEYGVINLAEPESVANWYQDIHQSLEKYDIARSAWTYKQMDFGIIDEHYATVYDRLKKYL